VGECIT